MSSPPQVGGIAPCRPLGLWASLAWGAAALALWLVAQVALVGAALTWFAADETDVSTNALVVASVTIGAVPATFVVIALAARSARCRLTDFLALRWPGRRDLVVGLVLLALLIPAVDLLSLLAGYDVSPAFVTNLFRNARDSGTLPLLVLGLAGAAPLIEEAIFRGVFLPGMAASRLGPAGAIAVTSLVWALLHLQYQPFYLIQAVILGVMFGWMRLRSGSTLLTILLHAIVNLTSLVQAWIVVEWWS
jgi:hypothetical protein